jgi:hypothetical protein
MTRSAAVGLTVSLLVCTACRDAPSENQRIADSIVASLVNVAMPPTAAAGWQAADSVPHRRLEGATAKIGTRAYLIGGFGGPELMGIREVDIFDHRTGQWSAGASLPAPVTHMQAAVVGDTAIWIAGGFDGQHPAPPTDAVWRYDVGGDRWLPGPALPEARGGGALLALGDTLYFVGGWAEDRATDRREMWRLLPRAARWDTRAPIPEGRGHVGAVAADGRLFLLGGQQSHDLAPVDLESAWSYDPRADRWTAIANAPATRSHAEPGALRWGNWVLVPGGGDIGTGRRYIADFFGYDWRRDRWRRLPDLPTKLRGAHAWIDADTFHITGGAEVNNTPSNWVRWKHALRGEWMELPGDGPKVSSAMVTVVGDDLLLFSADQRATVRYDLRAGRWRNEDDLPFRPRQGQVAGIASEGEQLQLLGGTSVLGATGLMQAYDGVRRRWSPGVPVPANLVNPEVVIASGVPWLVSGSRDSTHRGTIFRLSVGGRWDSVTSPPLRRHRPAVATDGSVLCLFGGVIPGKGRWGSDVQCLDLATRQWRTSANGEIAPGPELYDAPKGALFASGRFWVAHGRQLHGYDLVHNTWSLGAAPEQAGFTGVLAADGDRLVQYIPRTGRIWMLWP